MVNSATKNLEKNFIEIVDFPKDGISWSSVSLSEVINKGKRFDAQVFDVESKHIRNVLNNGKYPLVQLDGDEGLIEDSFYPGRFKRIYCEKGEGIEFYLPSQMADIYPEPTKWISKLTKASIEKLRLEIGTLLLTRSGTIGNVTIVSKTLKNKVFSDDVIRTSFRNEEDLGYVYAYLKSEYGNNILKTNSYGSVITHIEPEHLKEMLIPDAPFIIKKKIHDLIMDSYANRDESNRLIDEATKIMIEELELPPIDDLKKEAFSYSRGISSFSTKLSDLDGRLEGSYHIPLIEVIEKYISKKAELRYLDDKNIVKSIILPGRFARIYVTEKHGVPFIGGKDLFQLKSETGKYLSKKAHKISLEKELLIKENSIILPSRGTLGSAMLAMPHQIGKYAISDNLMQMQCTKECVGYIYIFLNSIYGKNLIYRQKYGGVVNAIEPVQLEKVCIPFLRDTDKIKYINDIALRANELRYQAYKQEQKAIEIMNREVLGL